MDCNLLHHQKPGEERRSCYPRRIRAFYVHVTYLVVLSSLGFLTLQLLTPKTDYVPRKIDLLFTAVSAATVSSMSTVEMEAFSDPQLMVLAVLMFLGGEIFISMIGLIVRNLKNEVEEDVDGDYLLEHDSDSEDPEYGLFGYENPYLENDALDHLISSIWRYIVVVHFLGVGFLFFYLTLNRSAAEVLRSKGLKASTFTVFTVISTFSNCGFVPTNENLIVFRENSGLLLILIPQVLLGNTLFPFCLRIFLRFHSSRNKREESEYLLSDGNKIDFFHLLPSLHSLFLAATAFCFTLIGFLMFAAFEWDSAAFDGLNPFRRAVCILFEVVNARHSGETVVDLSKVTPAVLVFFIAMMYLPPYTSFLPIKNGAGEDEKEKKQRSGISEHLVFSQLSYLAIFVIAICISEKTSMENDPLNFNVLNITLEVISAYGNVGFTAGYSCERRLIQDGECVSRWYGFVGAWSDQGKIVLLVIMFFGRLKQFNTDGGRAWKLL